MIDKNIPFTSNTSSRKRVRMRDVAARAGVSVSTVSLVLSGDIRIPEDTTRKVLQTVKAMEYRPNIIARNLARKGSRTIGVILPEHAFTRNQSFFYQCLHGIHSQTQPGGYKILVEAANKVFLERRYYHRLLKEQSADGVIYMAAMLNDTFLSDMVREPMPFVLLSSVLDDSNLPSVQPNNQLASELATKHLISLGHKKIAFIGGPETTSMGRDRSRGYRNALKETGLAIHTDLMVNGEFGTLEADSVMDSLMVHRPTAIVAAGDQMAYGVLSALRRLGRKVPDDVAVVGIDDLSLSSWVTPSWPRVKLIFRDWGAFPAGFA